ncbi:MAG: hypothetical protein J6B37_04575 [Clostridia bacterium]|nr:hypothetical protein [Clostridia bacterium]
MSETTYKSARKSLVEKGWIIHKPSVNGQQGEIIVDYDTIYKSAERDVDNTPSPDIENTPSNSDCSSAGVIEYTHNNKVEKTNNNIIKSNIINKPKVNDEFSDEKENFIF